MIYLIFASFVLSMVLSAVILLKTLDIAFKNSLFDKPNERKIHHGNIPRLGGIALYLSSTIAFLLVMGSVFLIDRNEIFTIFSARYRQLVFFLCAATILFGFGLYDDLVGLRYRSKFLGQIIAGLLLCLSGVWVKDLHGLFGIHALSPLAGYPLTIFAVLLITNAINFIDGIDGLAGSLCAICLLIDAVFSFCTLLHIELLISVSVLATLFPFLYLNIKGKADRQKKIFMGDTGSLFLGLVIAAIGISISNIPDAQYGVNTFVLAFSPLIVPCFDVVRVVVLRLYKNKSPFNPDQTHIHHMLLATVGGQGKVLLILLGISLLMVALSIAISSAFNIDIVFYADILVWVVIMMLIARRKTKKIEK